MYMSQNITSWARRPQSDSSAESNLCVYQEDPVTRHSVGTRNSRSSTSSKFQVVYTLLNKWPKWRVVRTRCPLWSMTGQVRAGGQRCSFFTDKITYKIGRTENPSVWLFGFRHHSEAHLNNGIPSRSLRMQRSNEPPLDNLQVTVFWLSGVEP